MVENDLPLEWRTNTVDCCNRSEPGRGDQEKEQCLREDLGEQIETLDALQFPSVHFFHG